MKWLPTLSIIITKRVNPLDAEGELNTDVDLAGHLNDLGELDGLLSGVLEVLDGEDLKAGLVDLESEELV
jgi:hypothetical protein